MPKEEAPRPAGPLDAFVNYGTRFEGDHGSQSGSGSAAKATPEAEVEGEATRGDQQDSTLMHCKCGSTSHLRISHIECPLNKKTRQGQGGSQKDQGLVWIQVLQSESGGRLLCQNPGGTELG